MSDSREPDTRGSKATVAPFRVWRGSPPHVAWSRLPYSLQHLRRGRDSNPRYPFEVHAISSRAPSAARSPLQSNDLGLSDRARLSYSSIRAVARCGESGIRTHGTRTGTPDFESGAFDHSAISPRRVLAQARSRVSPVPKNPRGLISPTHHALPRRSLKKPVRSAEQSSARTPATTSKR